MGALDDVVPFTLPKRKPRVIEKEPAPDRRKFAVVPIKAITDKRLHNLAIRILVCACSYANKAGITWVGQNKIASDLQIHQSQVSRELKKLKEYGYVDVIGKGFKGMRGDTIRVIYDSDLTTEDALSIASAGQEEDLRAPYQREKERRQMEEITEAQAKENQKRLTEMLKTAFKTPSEANKQIYKPVKGDTMTVRKMKEDIQKAKRKPVDKSVDNSVDKSYIYDMGVIIDDDMDVIQTQKDKDRDKYIGLEYIKDKVKYYCLDDMTESNLRYVEMLDQIKATNTELDLVGKVNENLTVKRYAELVIDLATRRK